MSTYVMSDLHGNYDYYKKMLEKISFSAEDTLYILGDILDRGPHPIKILLDLMGRENVHILAGNHEAMALGCLNFLMQDITEDSISQIDEDLVDRLMNWQENGCKPTTDEFMECDRQTQRDILDFICEFDLYEELAINGRSFLLVHAGLGNFSPDKPIQEYDLDDLVWERPDYTVPYFQDRFVVTGHTPTVMIEGNPRPWYIFKGNNHIAIDCGCNYPKGRLGCIRLEDLEEFYVEG